MSRRRRTTCVLLIVGAGILLVIGATQTWAEVRLVSGGDPLAVSGAAAVPVLAPLGLAAVALGLALTVVGRVLRYVLGVLADGIGLVLLWLTARMIARPLDAVAGTVTTATGIDGSGVEDLVAGITITPWPFVADTASVALLAAGVLVLATARTWGRTGRRFDAADAPAVARPHDAVDSWDDLSRGADPTA